MGRYFSNRTFTNAVALFVLLVLAFGCVSAFCLPQAAEARTVDRTVKVYKGGYEANGGSYDLVEGHIQKFNNDLHYFYSDGYFSGDPTVYDAHLATCGLNLEITAFASTDGTPESYATQSQTTQDMLYDMGFYGVAVDDAFKQKPTTDSIGVAVAQRAINITENGNKVPYVLVSVVIRGGGYEAEWASNVTLGTSGEAEGFADAADQTKTFLENYITTYGLRDDVQNGKVKFWVVGYSRAGATANLTSKRLIDDYQKYGDDVYGYCYEAPQGGINAAEKSGSNYNSIHNIINYSDLVPLVAPSSMGFKRYGVDHYVPGFYTGYASTFQGYNDYVRYASYDNNRSTKISTRSDNWPEIASGIPYIEQRIKMKEQLGLMNPGQTFDDEFHLEEMLLVKNLGFGKTQPVESSGNVLLQNYCAMLIEKLQEWSLTSRQVYAGTAVKINGKTYTTPEKAFRVFTKLIMGSDAAKSEGVMKCLMLLKDASKWDMAELYTGIVRDWNNLSENIKEAEIRRIWKYLDDTEGEEYLSKYLSASELSEFEIAFYTLCDTLFKFVNRDNRTDADDIFGREYGDVSDETMVLLGTAISLGKGLVAPHFEDTNLAWLRSYDSFYEDHPVEPADGKYTAFIEYASADGSYSVEQYRLEPGDTIMVTTKDMRDKRFVKWVEKPHQDSKAANWEDVEVGPLDDKQLYLTMPAEGNVYLKAYYEDVVYYDNLNIDVVPLSERKYHNYRGYIDSWKVWQIDGENAETGKGGNQYIFDRVVTKNIGGKDYELCEYNVSLTQYLDYFNFIPRAQHVQLNGAPIVDPANATSEDDLMHLGVLRNVSGKGYNALQLTFWLPAPKQKVSDVEQCRFEIPAGTPKDVALALLPDTVDVTTDDGVVQRSVTWDNAYDETCGPGNWIINGRYATDGLDIADYPYGNQTFARMKVYSDYTVINPGSGSYKDGVEIAINSTCEGDHTVYYTLDGSNPADSANENRMVYTQPFMLTAAQLADVTQVKAVTYREDSTLPGPICEETYAQTVEPIELYSVSYHLNDSETEPAENGNPTRFANFSPDIALEPATRMCYDFCGWYGNAALEGDPITVIPAGTTQNVELWAKWEVNPADPAIAVSLEGWTYGDVPHTPIVSGNNGKGAVTFSYKSADAPDDSCYSSEVPTAAGRYIVKAELAATDLYKAGSATGTFEISKGALQLSATGYSGSYDSIPHGIDVSVTGPGEGEYALAWGLAEDAIDSLSKPEFADAGEYDIWVRAIADNYEGPAAHAAVIITQATPSFTLTAEDSTYGDDLNIGFSTTSANLDVKVLFKSAGADDSAYTEMLPKDAGSYVAKLVAGDGVNYEKRESAEQEFSIAPRLVLVYPAQGQSKYFGTQDSPICVEYSGLIDDVDPGAVIGRAAGEEVGEYSYYLANAPSDPTGNYYYEFVTYDPTASAQSAPECTFAITHRPIALAKVEVAYDRDTGEVTVSASDAGKETANVLRGILADISDEGAGVDNLVEDEDYTVETVVGMDAATELKSLMVSVSGKGNYCGTCKEYFPLAVYLLAGDYEGVYDGKPHGIMVSVFDPEPSECTLLYGLSQDEITLTEMPQFTDAGEYDVWVKASAEGYEDTVVSAHVSIKPNASPDPEPSPGSGSGSDQNSDSKPVNTGDGGAFLLAAALAFAVLAACAAVFVRREKS